MIDDTDSLAGAGLAPPLLLACLCATMDAPIFCQLFPLDISRHNDYLGPMNRRSVPHPPLPMEDRIFISLQKTADSLGLEAEQLFKPHGLTGTQYNVLRILRGAEPDGLACSSIGERMISHDPDMTRLLDRMEKRGLISRARQTDDRRVIKTRITPAGLALLKSLDQPVRELHKRQFHHLPARRLKTLAQLLEEVRARGPE
jgi:DNA-binding MarR family transcriptional regulator